MIDKLNESPFRQLLGIEITDIGDGYAEGRLLLGEEHSSNNEWLVAHGGLTFSLADSVAGAAVISKEKRPTPTIDYRIDYINPGTDDLFATAELLRYGKETALSEVEITDSTGQHIAIGRGIYKTGSLPDETPWDIGFEE